MKVEQKAVKDYMNQRGWTYLNRSIPFQEVRMMLTEFAEQQVKLLATPAVVKSVCPNCGELVKPVMLGCMCPSCACDM
jgi:hypothetical protein